MVNPNYLQHFFGTLTQYILAHRIKLSVIGVTGKGEWDSALRYLRYS